MRQETFCVIKNLFTLNRVCFLGGIIQAEIFV